MLFSTVCTSSSHLPQFDFQLDHDEAPAVSIEASEIAGSSAIEISTLSRIFSFIFLT